MANLKMDLACADYDRTRALQEGTVQPVGIDLRYLRLPVEDIFWRMSIYQEFDASEMSLSAYLIYRSRPNPPFMGIPVFPSKFFRHSCVFIHTGSGVKRPQDLVGKRIGVPEYAMTAIVWLRGIMQHDYGVSPKKVTWVTGGLEEWGRKERVSLNLPKGIRVEAAPEPKSLNQMLEAGEIDALFTARTPSAFWKGSPRVARLFPNYKEVEIDYYRRSGVFPIMHLIVIKESIYREHPWVAKNLYDAFSKAKALCLDQLNTTSALPVTLPWLVAEIEASKKLLGEDYWAYGVEPNRKTLEALAQYSYEQGLAERKLTPEELFAKETLETSKV